MQTPKVIKEFREKLLTSSIWKFEDLALEVFKFQYEHNPVYRNYVKSLRTDINSVSQLTDIPFLPIEFFKTQHIKTGKWEETKTFKSSGTTGMKRSEHLVDEMTFYYNNTVELFKESYGFLKDWEIIALLPSYQEQGQSSLIAMIDYFIKTFGVGKSGYYKPDTQKLKEVLESSIDKKRLLIGVTYALVELAESGQKVANGTVVMETGGMKGRRKEITRDELHNILTASFKVSSIHSEYGMTELFSQAYAKKNGHFRMPKTLRVLIRDINDPFDYVNNGQSGVINIVDLANIHSCCFIETKDLGRKVDDNYFEVLGRMDNSDIRGCSLLY